jgi:hypothetical protein
MPTASSSRFAASANTQASCQKKTPQKIEENITWQENKNEKNKSEGTAKMK